MSKQHFHLYKKSEHGEKNSFGSRVEKGGKSPSGCFCSGDSPKAQTQALSGDRRRS